MDVFSWSIPFVIEKVTEILLRTGDPKIVAEESKEITPATKEVESETVQKKLIEDAKEAAPKSKLGSKADLLRSKVRTMARMLKMMKTI